ncbi:MAG: DUF1893 domain-containing protein [Clostridia bacterium]
MSMHTAMDILASGNYTCVVIKNGLTLMASDKKGVLPLVEFLLHYPDMKGCILADRVIGKAAALLCIKAKFLHVHARVMSQPAAAVLKHHGIHYDYDMMVNAIQNRQHTGLCPMESLSDGVEDPDLMFRKASEWLRSKHLL